MEWDTDDEEILEEWDAVPFRIRIPGARGRGEPPAETISTATNPGMWLNLGNVKPAHLADVEVDSMKKFFLDYKQYSQNECPRQLLREMQQFILEEQLGIIWDEDGREAKNGGLLSKIQKWRNLMNTNVQYVEDFKFWVLEAGNTHRITEKEIVKMFEWNQDGDFLWGDLFAILQDFGGCHGWNKK